MADNKSYLEDTFEDWNAESGADNVDNVNEGDKPKPKPSKQKAATTAPQSGVKPPKKTSASGDIPYYLKQTAEPAPLNSFAVKPAEKQKYNFSEDSEAFRLFGSVQQKTAGDVAMGAMEGYVYNEEYAEKGTPKYIQAETRYKNSIKNLDKIATELFKEWYGENGYGIDEYTQFSKSTNARWFNEAVLNRKVENLANKYGASREVKNYLNDKLRSMAYQKVRELDVFDEYLNVAREKGFKHFTQEDFNNRLKGIKTDYDIAIKGAKQETTQQFNIQVAPIKEKWNNALKEVADQAPYSKESAFSEAKSQVDAEIKEEVRLTYKMRDIPEEEYVKRINEKATKLYETNNKEFFELNYKPVLEAGMSEMLDLQKRFNADFKKRASNIKASTEAKATSMGAELENKNKMLATTADALWKEAIERYTKRVESNSKTSYNEAQIKIYTKGLFSKEGLSSLASIWGERFMNSIGSYTEGIGYFLNSMGLSSDVTNFMINGGREAKMDNSSYLPSFTDAWYDPLYMTGATGKMFGTMLPIAAVTTISGGNIYLGGLTAFAGEGASMSGNAALAMLEDGKSPTESAKAMDRVFVKNLFTTLPFSIIGAKIFSPFMKGKGFWHGAKNMTLGAAGQSAEEGLQSTFEEGKEGFDFRQFKKRETWEMMGETFLSSMIIGGGSAGIGSGLNLMRIMQSTKSIPAPHAQLFSRLNTETGNQWMKTGSTILYLGGELDDAQNKAFQADEEVINKISTEAEEIGLSGERKDVFVGMSYDIKNLEAKKEQTTNESAKAVLEKQISAKKSELEAVVDGSAELVTMNVMGMNYTMTTENFKQAFAESEEFRSALLASEGNVVINTKNKEIMSIVNEYNANDEMTPIANKKLGQMISGIKTSDFNQSSILNENDFAEEMGFDAVPESGVERVRFLKYRNEYLKAVSEKAAAMEQSAAPVEGQSASQTETSAKPIKLSEKLREEYSNNRYELNNIASGVDAAEAKNKTKQAAQPIENEKKAAANLVRDKVRSGVQLGIPSNVMDVAEDDDIISFVYDQSTDTRGNSAAKMRRILGDDVVDAVVNYVNSERSKKAEEQFSTFLKNRTPRNILDVKSNVKAIVERLNKRFPNVKVKMDEESWDKAMQTKAAKNALSASGIVYGKVHNGVLYLNPEFANYNTPIHEFGHVWLTFVRENHKDIYDEGVRLIKGTPYYKNIKNSRAYKHLSDDQIAEEALATAIGDRGEQLVIKEQRKSFTDWLNRMIQRLANAAGIFGIPSELFQKMTIGDFLDMAIADMFSGKPSEATVARQEKLSVIESQSLANKIEVGGVDISYILDIVYNAGVFLKMIAPKELMKTMFFNFDRDIRKPVISHLSIHIGQTEKRIEELKSKLIGKDGDVSKFRKGLLEKTQQKLELYKKALEAWENNAFSLDDISINGLNLGGYKSSLIEKFSVGDKMHPDSKVNSILSGLSEKSEIQMIRGLGAYFYKNVMLQFSRAIGFPSVHLDTIIVSEQDRGKGYASAAMKDIIEVADNNNIALSLYARAFGQTVGLSTRSLVEFYKKNGFTVDEGQYGFTTEEELLDYIDEYPSEAVSMTRLPEGFDSEEKFSVGDDDSQIKGSEYIPQMESTLTNLAEAVRRVAVADGKTPSEIQARIKSILDARLQMSVPVREGWAILKASIKRIAKEQADIAAAQIKQSKKDAIFGSPQYSEIYDKAKQAALALVKAKKGKTEALESVKEAVRNEVTKMYEEGNGVSGVFYVDMLGVANKAAEDAVNTVYPGKKMKSVQEEEVVNTSFRSYISDILKSQKRAIKKVKLRAASASVIVREINKQIYASFGRRLMLNPSGVRSMLKEINDATFSSLDDITANEELTNAIKFLFDKYLKKQLTTETEKLLKKLKDRIEQGKFSGVMDGIMAMASEIAKTDISKFDDVRMTVEDIFDFNMILLQLTGKNTDSTLIARALDMSRRSGEMARTEVKATTLESIKAAISALTKKLKENRIDIEDYTQLVKLKARMEDLRNRVGELSDITAEERVGVINAFNELENLAPDDIDDAIEDASVEILARTMEHASLLSGRLLTDSDFRNSFKNNVLYNYVVKLSKLLKDSVIRNMTPEEQASVMGVIGEIFNGNVNVDAIKLVHKIERANLSTQHSSWAKNISGKRAWIAASKGFVGFFNKLRSLLMDVDANKDPEVIADHLDLLKFHAMDVELSTGKDELNIGFLEREVFAPMAHAFDKAHSNFTEKLKLLQKAMKLIAKDKDGNALVKKGIGYLNKNFGTGTLFNDKLIAYFKNMLMSSSNRFSFEVSVRMATIIANQIDHISNLEEGENAIDIVLVRNILKGMSVEDYDGRTMIEHYEGNKDGLKGLNILDLVAYSALTEGGRYKLSDMSAQQLMSLLSESQREVLSIWRKHIEETSSLVEAAMIMKGSVTKFLKNYFPRSVESDETVREFTDTDSYISSVEGNIGVDSGQLKSRRGEKGALNLDGNRVLYRNLRDIELVINLKPFLERVKGLDDATEELSKNKDVIASKYSQAISIAMARRLNAHLQSSEKTLADSFGTLYRIASAITGFAYRTVLLNINRALADFVSNIGKLTAAVKSEVGILVNINNSFKAEIGNKKIGYKKWEDYSEVVIETGSHTYNMMSAYADNFMYEFTKDKEQLDRIAKVSGWQDILVKKKAWMYKFEEGFKKITGDVFVSEAYNDKRGIYRIIYNEAVERASRAADAFVDKQFGSSSESRQPIKYQMLAAFFGRVIRSVSNGKITFTLKRANPFSLISRFMTGYVSTQYQLASANIRAALSLDNQYSKIDRAKLITQAILETIAPSILYSVLRATQGIMLITTVAAVSGFTDDKEDRERLIKELNSKSWLKRNWAKIRLRFSSAQADNEFAYSIYNAVLSAVVDPNTSYALRLSLGIAIFQFWKEEAIEKMNEKGLSKEDIYKMKAKIRTKENMLFTSTNIRPLELFTSDEYQKAIQRHYPAGAALEGVEDLTRMQGGLGILLDEMRRTGMLASLIEKSKTNKDLSKDELAAAAVLKTYGIFFANVVFSGKYSSALSMISGDANKFANTIIKDQESIQIGTEIEQRAAEKEKEKNKEIPFKSQSFEKFKHKKFKRGQK